MTDPTGKYARYLAILQAYNYTVRYYKGSTHYNADVMSRPILNVEPIMTVEQDISTKLIDTYKDSYLLEYLKTGQYMPGSSKKQCTRVQKAAKRFKLINNEIFYKEKPELDEYKLRVTRIEDREKLIREANEMGHFAAYETYLRIREKYYWKNMIEMLKDLPRVVIFA